MSLPRSTSRLDADTCRAFRCARLSRAAVGIAFVVGVLGAIALTAPSEEPPRPRAAVAAPPPASTTPARGAAVDAPTTWAGESFVDHDEQQRQYRSHGG